MCFDPHFGEPSAHIIPTHTDDVSTPEGLSAQVIARPVFEEFTIAEAEVVHEIIRIFYVLGARARGPLVHALRVPVALGVSADETFVPFTYDPSLAASMRNRVSRSPRSRKVVSYLLIAVLTMARTTAFMPALSPPEVSTAIFMCAFSVMVNMRCARGDRAGGCM